MTLIVPVITGVPSTAYVSGPQYGVKYVLTGPDGSRAVFNDPTDRDYVGALSEVTGLDSPEVRENADNLVAMDGGIHGNFYYGRRPITMSGLIYGVASTTERNDKLTKIERASNAMRGDASLLWTPDGGEEQQIWLRRQQPLRFSGGWNKDFQIAMVAADARIYSSRLYTAQTALTGGSPPSGYIAQVFAANNGAAPTPTTLTITGPVTNPAIYNTTNGGVVSLTITLASTDNLAIDLLNHTAVLNSTTSKYSSINFTTTKWFFLDPGVNDLRVTASSASAGSGLSLVWRSAWV